MDYIVNTDYKKSYIGDINENGGILKWEYDNKPDMVIVVSFPFYDDYSAEDIVNLLNNNRIDLDANDVCIKENVFCRTISTIQGKNVCKMTRSPATFLVFGCEKHDNTLIIYDEKNHSHNTCKVSAKIGYRTEKIIERKTSGRLFNKSTTEYAFSKITILDGASFFDGDLYYCFEGCSIKFFITKNMIGKPFFVKWYKNIYQPIIKANVDGITIERR